MYNPRSYTIYILLLACFASTASNIHAMKRKRSHSQSKKSNQKSKNRKHVNAIFKAIVQNNLKDVLTLFDDPSFDINTTNNQGYTPLLFSVQLGRFPIAITLLDHKDIDINFRDKTDRSILHHAVSFKYTRHRNPFTSKLLTKGAGPNTQADGSTPLHIAIANNLPFDLISLIINHTTNLNTQDAQGNTPLHIATEKQNTQVTIKLLTAGAAPSLYICNNDNKIPADLSKPPRRSTRKRTQKKKAY